ncbi:uncharacterized mitochondrial protein AtMg00860-like [Nicotiana sylvestris]|uniref:uncharacterized mitochondrial protein AtMg00860-like n=1 Tax=Nicotiana sylvestris TaxID=4096 RepID=UPI00388C3E82
MQTLYQHQLYAMFPKCELWIESVTFVGHVISKEGIKVDPQKIAVVKKWPRSTTPIEIRSFLGLAGYYRKFMQKDVKFHWSDVCERSFQELKSRSTIAPVLTLQEDFGEGGVVVPNRDESSLVVEVKEK